MSRIAERLVFHRGNLPLVAPRHRRQSARRVERLELAYRLRKHHRLALGERLHLLALPIAHDPRERRVVVEHALERVDDLIAERPLGLLRESTDEELSLI